MGYQAELYLMQLRHLSVLVSNTRRLNAVQSGHELGPAVSCDVQVEQLDLVQLHWWDYSVGGMVETAKALDTLRKQGLIRSIGLTNMGCEGLQQILDAGVPIVSNQVHVGGIAPAVHAQLHCLAHSRCHLLSSCCRQYYRDSVNLEFETAPGPLCRCSSHC